MELAHLGNLGAPGHNQSLPDVLRVGALLWLTSSGQAPQLFRFEILA